MMTLLKPAFYQYGKNFKFDPFGFYTHSTISVGDDVFIGKGAVIRSSMSTITIGNKIMMGPNVTIIGGDHNTTEIGKYMYEVKDKLPENDLPVVIEDDVWIGTGAIILKGVTIGTGSIVAAGSLVIKSIPPYSVVGGIPAKVLKKRFDVENLKNHEMILSKKG